MREEMKCLLFYLISVAVVMFVMWLKLRKYDKEG